MDINDIVNRRSDLSTFLVHLSRADGEESAADRLESILTRKVIEARSMYGHLKRRLEHEGRQLDSQKVVCFTETPLEFTNLMVEPIDHRNFRFAPYGIAITKKMGRQSGINPVWYLDMTPGHTWLTNNLDRLAERFLQGGAIDDDLASIFPFVEHMGRGQTAFGENYRKEFWWEREWRHVGDFRLPLTLICLCPEDEIPRFTDCLEQADINGKCVDPRWSLEKIIARLAGFTAADVNIL
jgi:hypothetical protein